MKRWCLLLVLVPGFLMIGICLCCYFFSHTFNVRAHSLPIYGSFLDLETEQDGSLLVAGFNFKESLSLIKIGKNGRQDLDFQKNLKESGYNKYWQTHEVLGNSDGSWVVRATEMRTNTWAIIKISENGTVIDQILKSKHGLKKVKSQPPLKLDQVARKVFDNVELKERYTYSARVLSASQLPNDSWAVALMASRKRFDYDIWIPAGTVLAITLFSPVGDLKKVLAILSHIDGAHLNGMQALSNQVILFSGKFDNCLSTHKPCDSFTLGKLNIERGIDWKFCDTWRGYGMQATKRYNRKTWVGLYHDLPSHEFLMGGLSMFQSIKEKLRSILFQHFNRIVQFDEQGQLVQL